MPLLLDAAGLLHAEARAAWRAHPVFGRWWEGAVSALLARPFLTVRNLQTAVEHVLATSGYARPLLAPFFEWCIGHAAGITSLLALMQDLARPADGHYLPGPLQEVLLATLLGKAEALALARRLDETQQDPAAAPRLGLHVAGEAKPDAPQSGNPSFADSPPPPPHEPVPARPRLHLHWGEEPVPRLPAGGGPPILDGDTAQSVTGVSPPPGRNNTSPAPIDPIVPPAGRANVSQPSTPRAAAAGEGGAAGGMLTLRTALRAGLRLAAERSSPEEELKGWKLFMLAPRMLLHREPGTARISPEELQSRCDLFSQGLWQQLLQQAARAARASALVHIGEFSAVGHALVSEPLAPGNEDTLQQLCDPARRPNAPYAPISPDVLNYKPADAIAFPITAFLAALRTARRGAAACPSGMTNEHVRILLDEVEDSQLLHNVAERFAQANVPPDALAALRVGRVVALRKPGGGVRALIVGDVLTRLVGEAVFAYLDDTYVVAAPERIRELYVWYGRGPPAEVRSPTNSWLYVPLLHAALGALTDGALAQWRADPRAAPWWEEARRALAASAPVPVAALTEALIAAAIHNHEALPETALAEAATLPSSTLIHLGWVVRHLVGEDGYITAAGQAVCLETFGGAGLATTLDRRSDIFRYARRLTVTYGAIEPPPL
ncbi:unnamed protein product, partial [Symbiodinium pilosum]